MQVNKLINITKALWANVFVDQSEQMQANVMTSEYIRRMLHSIEHKGKHWTVNHWKKLHIIAKAVAMEAPFEILPWTRAGKDGIPSILRPMVPYLRGNSQQKRTALTITRSYELIIGNPELNLEPITSPSTLPFDSVLHKEFALWVVGWKERIIGKRLLALKPMDTMMSSPGTKGPNGPSLLTSHLDAVAMYKEPNLLKSIQFFSPFLKEQVLGLVSKYKGKTDNLFLSRIALIAEAGLKTRTIAIGDYWTQNALRPLHDSLMGILKRLETDGTWNQDSQSERIKKLATDQSVSYDLTSATDRFPITFQKLVLEVFYGKPVSEHWANLMVNRKFKLPNSDEFVTWAVGQPLGFYSSWATFALSHHALIEFCAWRVGHQSFKSYAVLGDDVVIWNSAVAREYETVLTALSVKINMSKTILSQPGIPRVEFAKRLFYKGTEISGLSWSIISQASRSIAGLVDLFILAKNRSWEIPSGDHFRSPLTLSDKGRELFGVLYWERTGGEAPFPVSLPSTVTLQDLRSKVIHLRLAKLLKLQRELDTVLCGNKPMVELFKTQGLEIDPSLLDYAAVMHPIATHVNYMGMMIWDLLDKLNDDVVNDLVTTEHPVLPFEFFPNMNTSMYFGDRKVLTQLYRSSLVWTVYYSLIKQAKVN